MKKKTIKSIAATMVLTFGITAMSMPALAVSSNIVAETENKNTLTISQIQDLAVIYNNTNQSLQLKKKQLALQEQMLRNNRRDLEYQMQSIASSSGMGGAAATIGAALGNLKAQLEAEKAKENPDAALIAQLNAQIAAMELQYGSAVASEESMATSLQSSLDSALSGLEQMNDTLDTMEDGRNDLDKSIADLESQMRYTAAALSLNALQLEKAIELMQDQIALTEKSVKIAELQQKLGMNIATDVSTAQASLVEAKKNLEDQKETLSNIKRSINILIGRNAGNPLEIVPMNLPVAIDPAPAYTQQLIDKFVDANYSLKTLERDKTNLRDSVKNDMGSDELQEIDYNILAKDQEIDNKKQAIEDDLKAMIAKINSDGEAYKVSRQKYVNEKKTFEFTQKKYELGMVSELALRQAELSLKSAEMTNMQNGYQYYLDWQKYYLAERGIDVSALSF